MTELVVVPAQARAAAKVALRMIAGDRKPLVTKIGPHWYAWDGNGWARPYRSWRGALRAVSS